MSTISAAAPAMALHAPKPAAPKGRQADGDGDHGVEPAATAQAQPAGGTSGSSGTLNRVA